MALEDRPVRPGIEGGDYRPLTDTEVSQINNAALRVLADVGDLGWELHHWIANADWHYSAILEAGIKYDIRDVGLYGLESMRLEKGYQAWGVELTTEVTVVEADMRGFTKFDKGFAGREANLAQSNGGSTTSCAYFDVEMRV